MLNKSKAAAALERDHGIGLSDMSKRKQYKSNIEEPQLKIEIGATISSTCSTLA